MLILEVVHILHNMLLILLCVLIGTTTTTKTHLPWGVHLTWTAYRKVSSKYISIIAVHITY